MNSSERFNEYLIKNGGSKLDVDENLMLTYEDKKERVYWASVYGSEFRRAPRAFFTSQATYRDFCVGVSGMMPKKRAGVDFDNYVRARLVEATVKETLPGLEEGVIAGHAVFSVIAKFMKKACDYDNPDRRSDVNRGDPFFMETRAEGPGYKEIFIRINYLMDGLIFEQSIGQLERKVTRDEIVDWLLIIGRTPYPVTASPRRLRSTYPIPYHTYMRWRLDDENRDEAPSRPSGT
jgi:hypothetical protein